MNQSPLNPVASAVLFGLVLALIGCGPGPGVVPVSGTITLDGKPLDDANVVFERIGGDVESMGRTDKDGRYRLGYKAYNMDGARLGKYKVVIVTNDVEGGASLEVSEEPMTAYEGRVPLKYLDGTIDLEFEVKEATDKADFHLDSKPHVGGTLTEREQEELRAAKRRRDNPPKTLGPTPPPVAAPAKQTPRKDETPDADPKPPPKKPAALDPEKKVGEEADKKVEAPAKTPAANGPPSKPAGEKSS